MPLIDLHTHTTASDGTLSPAELVAQAKALGLAAIAVTDHDTIDGLQEAMAAAKGIEVIPGVEISADFNGELHILGYYFDPASASLASCLAELRRYREERNPRIVSRLQELGFNITLGEVEQESGGKVVGRPHFAKVLLKKGYLGSIAEAFEKYLAVGKPAYFKKEKLSPREAIEVISQAGGIPVLAHPKYLDLSPKALEELVRELELAGLRGIEAFYSSHTPDETKLYREIGLKYGLCLTGGSDFHGDNKPEIRLGSGTGDLQVSEQLLLPIKKLVEKYGFKV